MHIGVNYGIIQSCLPESERSHLVCLWTIKMNRTSIAALDVKACVDRLFYVSDGLQKCKIHLKQVTFRPRGGQLHPSMNYKWSQKGLKPI